MPQTSYAKRFLSLIDIKFILQTNPDEFSIWAINVKLIASMQ